MKIAIPTVEGKLCMHFGHCEKFAIIEVDKNEKKIISQEFVTPPPHEPGLLPKWLNELGANCIIAGGMGGRAQELFRKFNINVVTGAGNQDLEELALDFLNDKLVTGPNTCDH